MKSSEISTANSTQVLENTDLNLLENKAFKILKKIKNFIPDNNSLYTKLVQHCLTVGKDNVYYTSLDKLLAKEYPEIFTQENGRPLYQELYKLMRLLCFENISIQYDNETLYEMRTTLENDIKQHFNNINDDLISLIGDDLNEEL